MRSRWLEKRKNEVRVIVPRVQIKRELAGRVHGASGQKAVFGLMNGELQNAWGSDFLYLDHSYFMRGWDKKTFRMVRGNVHLTRTIPQSKDRLKRFQVKLAPWKTDGSQIIVIQPSINMEKALGIEGLAQKMYAEVKKHTDREVFLKPPDKTGIPQLLKTAWAVVCPVSVAGVEAAVYGVPVFSTPLCPSWPVNAGELKDIENPERKERYEWANSLAWSSWHYDEIPDIDYANYQRDA